jgi:uncharacterized membrane protein
MRTFALTVILGTLTVILGALTVILGALTVILGALTVILGALTVILGLDPRIGPRTIRARSERTGPAQRDARVKPWHDG